MAALGLLAGRGFLERLELWTYDLRLELAANPRLEPMTRPSPPCAEVVVVAVDDRTEGAVPERLPMSRRRFAALIRAAHRGGASVIALDFFMPGRSYYDPEQDDDLARAMGEASCVVLGRKVTDELGGGYRVTDSSHPMFVEKAADQGFLLAQSDLDGVNRSLNVVKADPDSLMASLSLVAVMRHLNLASRQVKPEPDTLHPSRLVLAPAGATPLTVPLWKEQRLLLDFAAGRGRAPFRTISFIDFARELEREPGLVRGRIVLVGATNLSSHDRFVVPLSWLPAGAGLPGVYLHAMAMREMLRGSGVRRAAPWTRCVVLAALALVAAVLFRRLGPGQATAALGLGWLAMALAAGGAFVGWRMWVDVAPAAGLWGAAFVVELAVRYRAEARVRRRFEILLSTYHVAAAREETGDMDSEEPSDSKALEGGPVAWQTADLLEIRDYLAPPACELHSVLGRGGMSIVFGGRQRELDRQVAVKFLAPQLFADATARRRFLQEARLTAKVVHPHVVGIFDFGERNGVPYIVLEYLPGDSVKRRIRNAGALGTREALELARQALLGLAAAHELGIVHRDVKSENLLLTADGEVKVTDFGIAKAVAGTGLVHTMPEILLGTPATMSPEQARGEPVTARSDLYSMGVVLFEMLTGQLPFLGDTPTAILVKQIREPAPRLAQLRPGSPPELEELLEHALAKEPAQRFESAAAFGEAVDALLRTLPSDPQSTTRRTVVPAGADSVSATSIVQTGGGGTPAASQTVRWKKEKL